MSILNDKNKIVTNFNPSGDLYIGDGFHIEDNEKSKLYKIFTQKGNRLNHTFIFGSTGVGKTRLLENMIEQNIKNGENVVIIDPKGDTDLLSKVIYLAHLNNRENDLMFLSPIYPEQSIKINPLKHYYMPDEIIGHIMACIQCDDPFFYDSSLETTTLIVHSLLLIRDLNNSKEPLTFSEISKYTSRAGINDLYTNFFQSEELRNNIIDKLLEKDQNLGLNLGNKRDIYKNKVNHLTTLLLKVINAPTGYFEKVSNTLNVALTKMTSGNIGALIGAETDNKFITKLENNEGVIFFVQTGSMLAKITSSAIARVTISMIQTLVGRLNGSNKRFAKRLNVYIDEMAEAVFTGIETLYAQARSTDVAIVGLTQSLADIIAVLGQDSARKLFDNSATKIIMKMNDVTSAEHMAKFGGTRKMNSLVKNANGGLMTKEQDEDVIKVTDLLRLDKREFYYFGFEGQFKGITAPVTSSPLKIKFPEITIRLD